MFLQKKNIVIILKSFVLGGAEKQALFLANYLKKNNGCNIYIYSIIPKETDLFYKEINKYGLNNLYKVNNPLSASGKFKYLKRRVKIFLFGLKLRKHKPDLIIPYLNPPSIIASLCYKIAGAKITFWHHRGPDYYRQDLIEKKAANKVPFFIANSESGRKELNSFFNRSDVFFKFLSNFSTTKSIRKIKAIEDLNLISNDKIIIGMIAHFRKQKHQHILVAAFNKLLKKHNNIHLVLAGNIYSENIDESNILKVKSLIKDNKLNESVSIIEEKQASEVLPYLNIGVLVSDNEGMPNSIMEYMAYGLPVVATKHSGCISLLGNQYEYFTKLFSIEDVYDKLDKLVSSNETMIEVGNQNKKRLNQEFKIESYVNKLSELITNYA